MNYTLITCVVIYLLGAIVYLAGAVIALERQAADGS